jgi:hypothetical protein
MKEVVHVSYICGHGQSGCLKKGNNYHESINMSYIDYTRKSLSSACEITVCMTKEECKILLPFFQKAYKEVKSKYEKYDDIHSGGEATNREENLRMKYLEQSEHLESVLSSINDILK